MAQMIDHSEWPILRPVILSASRATDVPAFYSAWLLNRLRAGWCGWVNPFNQRAYRVSFENVRAAVFWTKNPAPMLERLDAIEALLPNFYFQFTLNDYEQESLEPNLPSLKKRLSAFERLAERLGASRVIWRFDPILLTLEVGPDEILSRIEHIGDVLVAGRFTEKLVVSFVDVMRYAKVRRNLASTPFFTKETVSRAEPSLEAVRTLAEGLARLCKKWRRTNPVFEISTCAEAADLSGWGISHNRCVDGDLLLRLFPHDRMLYAYLTTGTAEKSSGRDEPIELATPFFEATPLQSPSMVQMPEKVRRRLKDRGQRAHCGCMASKDIGAYNTCPHFCAYCYANANRETVLANVRRHDPTSPFLVVPPSQ